MQKRGDYSLDTAEGASVRTQQTGIGKFLARKTDADGVLSVISVQYSVQNVL